MFECSVNDGRIIFHVDYLNRDRAKSLGAYWDTEKKVWYKEIKRLYSDYENVEKIIRLITGAGFNVSDETLKSLDDGILACDSEINELEEKKRDYNAPQPDGIMVELRGYQKAGVQFLDTLDKALLCDDMGLGKTPQSISWARHKTPALVICPGSLKEKWRREVLKFIPGKSVCILSGDKMYYTSNGEDFIADSEKPGFCADYVLVNYDIIDRWLGWIGGQKFNTLIADEAHMIKNPGTQRTVNCLLLSEMVTNRLVVTGTPILNRPIELFTLLQFLGKVKKADFFWFRKRFCELEERSVPTYKNKQLVRDENGKVKMRKSYKVIGAKNPKALRAMIAPYFLRRLKKEVLKELPPKVYENRFTVLSNRKEYELAERDIVSYIRNTEGSANADRAEKAIFLSKLNRLRQLSVAGKMDTVLELLESLKEHDKKAVIFSTFVDVLDKLKEKLGNSAVIYTGSHAEQSSIDRFEKDDKCRWFLTTIKKGGVGLDLTQSDTVVFIDFPWTPGDKTQAEDRAHRYGQKNTVNVIHIIGEDTVDDMILDILKTKQVIIDQIVDGKDEVKFEDSDMAVELEKLLIKKHSKNIYKNT